MSVPSANGVTLSYDRLCKVPEVENSTCLNPPIINWVGSSLPILNLVLSAPRLLRRNTFGEACFC